ncbi:MAG: hypothetical protein OQL28_10315 [Sedimenticola sp.]|nr:hypothetical protein [Sedimenticola sp.]
MHPAYIAAILFLFPAIGAGSADLSSQPGRQAVPAPRHLFYRLAEQIAGADALQRFDFAQIALTELLNAYQASYRESLQASSSQARRNLKLARWRRGLDHYIGQLSERQRALDYQSRIEIVIPAKGPVSLFLDDNPVVISGPELARARQLEQQIVDRFCRLHDCTPYRGQPPAAKIEMPRVTAGQWQFQQHRSVRYLTPDGLEFIFRSMQQREAKQGLCEAIAGDLRLLVNEIRNARRAGYRIDWEALGIHTLYEGEIKQVTLNHDGDYLNLKLAYFGTERQPGPQLLAWIKRRTAEQAATAVIGDADQLLTHYRVDR